MRFRLRASQIFIPILLKADSIIIGGEPLLNKNFYSYVQAVKELSPDIFVKTVTNGMALTPANQDKILMTELDQIEISLDGLSKEESQTIRVGSNSEKIVKNIISLIERKRASGKKNPAIYISTTQFVKKACAISAQHAEPPAWLIDKFLPYVDADEIVGFKATFAMVWPHIKLNNDLYEVVKDPEDSNDKRDCDHVVNTVTIRADGTVLPCCYDLTSKLNMGNILNDRLEDIYNSDRYNKLRQSLTDGKYFGICNSCNVVKQNSYIMPRWRSDEVIDAESSSTSKSANS